MTDASPIINAGPVRLLNVPHAADVVREVWEEDCYRLSEIPDGSTVIDAGAFYGEFGLLCAATKGCTVMGFEPSAINCEIARCNLSLNASVVSTYRVSSNAIASNKEPRAFYYRPDHPAGSHFGNTPNGAVERVPCFSLNDIVQWYDTPLVVKLDIEGAEREVFDADLSWLSAVSIVTMEWHNHDGDRYAAVLRDHGFDVDVTGGGPPPRPPWDSSIGGGLLFARRL